MRKSYSIIIPTVSAILLIITGSLGSAEQTIFTMDSDTFKLKSETIRIANTDAPEIK